MATAKKSRYAKGGIRKVNAPVKDLVSAITETVLERILGQLPSREDIKELERNLRELSRRVEALSRRKEARRVGRPRSDRKCEVAGCNLPHVAQGYCSRHYQAWRRQQAGQKTRTSIKKAASRRKTAKKGRKGGAKR
jgi:hypothetical protein